MCWSVAAGSLCAGAGALCGNHSVQTAPDTAWHSRHAKINSVTIVDQRRGQRGGGAGGGPGTEGKRGGEPSTGGRRAEHRRRDSKRVGHEMENCRCWQKEYIGVEGLKIWIETGRDAPFNKNRDSVIDAKVIVEMGSRGRLGTVTVAERGCRQRKVK